MASIRRRGDNKIRDILCILIINYDTKDIKLSELQSCYVCSVF